MKILIIGGDSRSKALAQGLAKDGFYVRTYALDIECQIKSKEELLLGIGEYDIIVLPLPATRDGIYICSQGDCEKIPVTDLLTRAKSSAFILAGKVSAAFKRKANDFGLRVIDYYADEHFTDKNAYITAEGAIKIVMYSLQKTMRDSNHLIIGGGRIAKHLFTLLRGFGASVTLCCRDLHDIRWAQLLGAEAVDLLGESELIENAVASADVIYNTVPEKVIPDSAFAQARKGVQYIELVGDEALISPVIAQSGAVYSCEKGLPARYAPESAGMLLHKVISEIIRERIEKR